MRLHRLERELTLPGTIEQAWSFFSKPGNLARITPPELDFQVLTELPEEIYAGLFISYQVRPLFGIPMAWLTEITQVSKPDYFVDEQRAGPYRIWHHEHFFAETSPGKVTIRDRVHYALPLGIFAAPFEQFIKKKVETIFDFRAKVLPEIF